MVEGPSGKSFHVTTMQGCHRTRDLPREIENRTGRSRQENLEARLKRCDFSLQVASTGNCLLHSRELSSGPWCKNRLTLRIEQSYFWLVFGMNQVVWMYTEIQSVY